MCLIKASSLPSFSFSSAFFFLLFSWANGRGVYASYASPPSGSAVSQREAFPLHGRSERNVLCMARTHKYTPRNPMSKICHRPLNSIQCCQFLSLTEHLLEGRNPVVRQRGFSCGKVSLSTQTQQDYENHKQTA